MWNEDLSHGQRFWKTLIKKHFFFYMSNKRSVRQFKWIQPFNNLAGTVIQYFVKKNLLKWPSYAFSILTKCALAKLLNIVYQCTLERNITTCWGNQSLKQHALNPTKLLNNLVHSKILFIAQYETAISIEDRELSIISFESI